jgi:hypothetical protein
MSCFLFGWKSPYQHGGSQVELMKELCDEDVNLQDPRHILLLNLPVRREKSF